MAVDSARPLIDPSTIKFSKKDRQAGTIKLKRVPPKQTKPGNVRDSEIIGEERHDDPPSSPLVNPMNDKLRASFATGRLTDEPELVSCKHCRRSVLKIEVLAHVGKCLKVKADKARRKKEAKEAREREKQGIKDKDDVDTKDADAKDADGDSAVKGKASKTSVQDPDDPKKGKKRKAEADGDKGSKNKKNKKNDEAKPKAKPKGPVDVEKQCGVALPNGAQCARSLTCKSHSMGAKRGVPGRSLPYDMLLSQYQKKNQAKQQKLAIDANAPLQDDFDGSGPVDSDEEKDLIMTALRHYKPTPIEQNYFIPQATKNKRIRLKQCLEGQTGRIFSTPGWGANSANGDVPPTSTSSIFSPSLTTETPTEVEPPSRKPSLSARMGGGVGYVKQRQSVSNAA